LINPIFAPYQILISRKDYQFDLQVTAQWRGTMLGTNALPHANLRSQGRREEQDHPTDRPVISQHFYWLFQQPQCEHILIKDSNKTTSLRG
jgi:hypothetical protein